jgi:hypothetical protein
MLKKNNKPAIQFDADDLPPPVDMRGELKRKREKATQATEPTQKSKKAKTQTKKSKEPKELKEQPSIRPLTRPRRSGVVRPPTSLKFTVTDWADEEDVKLKAAIKKHGIPAPADASIKKSGLWYTYV